MCEITYTAAKTKLTIKYKITDGTEKEKTTTLTNTSGTRIRTKWQYTATDDTPNSIILKTTLKDSKGNDTITITGNPITVIVEYGHIFAETFDTSTVRPEIISPTLIVIVGIMKSQGIYDPYVFMGNWGGSHGPDTADGDLTLTPSASGNYNSGTTEITLTITKATYKTGDDSAETPLGLDTSKSTLRLKSGSDIKISNTHNLTRGNIILNLNAANDALKDKTYNVSLNITEEITLNSGGTIKLKNGTYSLGTYTLTTSDNKTYTGNPDNTDEHSSHKTTKCCIFGKQNTWSDKDNRCGWHSFTIIIPIKIFFLSILYINFTTTILWTLSYGYYTNTQKTVITYPKDITGNVTIKTGTVTEGKCNTAPTALTITGAKVTINPTKDGKGANLTITNITGTIYH